MVERIDATFQALADPTRRAMLAHLANGERSIGELAEPFTMSFAGASKHVATLEKAGLIERRRQGRQYLCTLRVTPLAEAQAWLSQWEALWTRRLDRLDSLIAIEKGEKV
ncbi:ArsR/SmtB family transcription factor [Sphingomonas sp. AX6]|uniref:ArsR/SmtB family transcription factor n=1 Tax=Sphingomonas sp. AX6 TaxID=2653171 RepID=UPI0012EFFE51|nr:metalloregulator ArsR/SmtB family transcription factor [Sphingomonas sp. AX6]VXC52091.1 Transcriptional regulator, ArsR family [Sphingomonas sp. AX6]